MSNILEAKNIVKKYANHTALNGVDISIETGSIFGLLGPNGAGKTSFIRIINQITAPDSGEVHFFGEPLKSNHVHQIGYLPEERGLYRKMKIGEQAMYLARLKGMTNSQAKAELKAWFERFGISDWWNKKVEELSKGMAQKVQFISTVLHKPKLLILDEPFSGFDPINAALIRKEILRLRDEGATVILSTHNMASVEEICDDIALINKSRVILGGSVTDVRNRFSNNEYTLRFKGNLISFTNALGARFTLVQNETTEGITGCTVRLSDGFELNDLLHSVLSEVKLLEVQPRVPSMNEIFIKAVQAETPVS
jgi:ABC-2 type transport system ATP-binding protein